jgi:ATP-dependent DNA helicase RecG
MEKAERHPLASLGCTSNAHALLVLPRGYIDTRFHRRTLATLPEGQKVLISAHMDSWSGIDKDGNASFSPFPDQLRINVVLDCGARFRLRIFSKVQEWLEALRENPREVQFIAALEFHPRFGASLNQVALGTCTNSVSVHYAGKSGASGELIQDTIAGLRGDRECVIQAAKLMMEQRGVVATLRQHGYTGVKAFIRDLHFPLTPEAGYQALAAARAAAIAEVHGLLPAPPNRVPLGYDLDKHLIEAVKAQPEQLSKDQRRALNQIRVTMLAGKGSRILLNGDVGTGKTLVFTLAAAAVGRASNEPVAIMAPSDLVARQIYANAVKRFPDLEPLLVIGGSNDSRPSKFYVGTQALLTRRLPKLALVVVDEQHKFSVAQRLALAHDEAHVIEACATPIPRSLALALFGEWVNVQIKTPPVERHLKSHWLSEEERRQANLIVRQHLDAGRKVMYLYPSVKGDGLLNAAERLGQAFPGKVVAMHGQSSEKLAALESFKSGATPIAAVSTVVEVGLDVPDIGAMVVNGADRFGIAQLHQLRGRLMRAGGAGDFILYTKTKKLAMSTTRRLEAICSTIDGFTLAEADLSIRGFGELLGECQAGGATQLFKLTDLKPEDFLEHVASG